MTNNVANDKCRVSAKFGIDYEDDIERARRAIIEEESRIEGVLEIH